MSGPKPEELPAKGLKLHLDSAGNSSEVKRIHGDLSEAHSRVVECDRGSVHVVVGQVSDVGQRDASIVHADTALSLSCRVEQS